ncbi:cation transport protein-domain-containing protein [Pisolithus marmoratus]|nr:cation transport protein-domain-containing protein [Pisolithus marmoratus]
MAHGGRRFTANLWRGIRANLNFSRVHLLFFTFIPLLASAVLYASNGKYPISYVDALFNSVSAMTVCGLSTVDLSSLTPWQQVILFLQMSAGSPVLVSWVMKVKVTSLRYYFAKKFDYIIAASAARRAGKKMEAQLTGKTSARDLGWSHRVSTLFQRQTSPNPLPESGSSAMEAPRVPKENEEDNKLGAPMIRGRDAPPRLVDPSGRITEASDTPLQGHVSIIGERTATPESRVIESNGTDRIDTALRKSTLAPLYGIDGLTENSAIPNTNTFHDNPEGNERSRGMSKAINVETTVGHQDSVHSTGPDTTRGDGHRQRRPTVVSTGDHVPLTRSRSVHTVPHSDGYPEFQCPQSVYSGFGGFPMPHQILGNLLGRLFPKARSWLHRTMTIPVTTSLVAPDGGVRPADGSKPVTYISFRATVGRNSAFRALTNEQLEELGGVEYRALNALLWLVIMYHFSIQIISFVVIAPYMSMSKWSSDFIPPALQRPVAPAWFSLFQVVSAYTNTGMSLVDQSMIPFQTAYPMIVFTIICMLAGNTAYVSPWVVTKIIPANSRLNETLHFLLDHPRRCFIYLFPSHQTWFLLTIVMNWSSFLILDIGNPAISSIPVGTRILAGVYQAIAVRNAGFHIVPLALLAPATKVMYVIMMYISVCDVRSTNVYEERSLGVFRSDEEDEETSHPIGSRVAIWGRYLGMHARRQLSRDMWWLWLALFLVCIIEVNNLDNPNLQGWFNIFTIIFELVSAYGSVGLSLGVPNQNYSFSGSLRPLSKLVVILVMLRGRHVGLPVAADRAVMLPSEFNKTEEDPDPQPTISEKKFNRHGSTRASRLFNRPGEATDIPKSEEGVSANRSESNELRLRTSRRNTNESSSQVQQ